MLVDVEALLEGGGGDVGVGPVCLVGVFGFGGGEDLEVCEADLGGWLALPGVKLEEGRRGCEGGEGRDGRGRGRAYL